MSALPQDELCPNCGEFVSHLDRATGFCKSCTGGGDSDSDYEKLESYLAANADHLEFFMMQGHALYRAIDLSYADNQKYRTCASCGGFIERGGPRSIFCRKNKRCRALVRRYEYLYTHKGMSKAQALAEVLK